MSDNEQDFFEKATRKIVKVKRIENLIKSIKTKFPRFRDDVSVFVRYGITYNVVSKNNEFYSGSFKDEEILFELNSDLNLVIDFTCNDELKSGIVFKKSPPEKLFISFSEIFELSDEKNLDKLSELLVDLESKLSKVANYSKTTEDKIKQEKRKIIEKLL